MFHRRIPEPDFGCKFLLFWRWPFTCFLCNIIASMPLKEFDIALERLKWVEYYRSFFFSRSPFARKVKELQCQCDNCATIYFKIRRPFSFKWLPTCDLAPDLCSTIMGQHTVERCASWEVWIIYTNSKSVDNNSPQIPVPNNVLVRTSWFLIRSSLFFVVGESY
jgi:hypothetical protein